MAESPIALLRAHARHAPWNARGLAAHVGALVDAAGLRPTNSSARAAPSPRAIRYYVATKLIDRPEGAGTTATYGYRHLLQLLSIKLRQREGHTLDAIKKEMREVTGDALERRVAQALLPALQGQSAAPPEDGIDRSWKRLVVSEGVEVHVRDGSAADSEGSLVAIREAVRSALTRGGRM